MRASYEITVEDLLAYTRAVDKATKAKRVSVVVAFGAVMFASFYAMDAWLHRNWLEALEVAGVACGAVAMVALHK